MAKVPPPRIYGIFARESPVAVLFRRGPSKQVELIRWDTSIDKFERGQWFKGRIYERRCDLSPDGRLLVYFAASWKARLGVDKGSWTAVSRPPYLTAIARWTKGDAWNGGGLFLDNQRLGLNSGGAPHRWATDLSDGIPLEISDLDLGRGEDCPIEDVRDTRDGWVVIQQLDATAPEIPDSLPPLPQGFEKEGELPWEYITEFSQWLDENPGLAEGYTTRTPAIFEKQSGSLTLRREERLDQFTRSRKYSVKGTSCDLGSADWVEWDNRGRLVYAEKGRLFAAEKEGKKLRKRRELADFTGHRFRPVEAPDWAKQWS